MRRVRFQRTARQDVIEIVDYITRRAGDRTTAARFAIVLQDRCRHVASLPGTLGKPRPDLGDDLRSIAARNYVIVFRYEPGTLRVIRIVEGHRSAEAFREDSI